MQVNIRINICTKVQIIKNSIYRTMLGPDFCSPTSGMSSKGQECQGTCKEDDKDETGHYKCYIDADRTRLEYCGLHATNIPGVVTSALEYSNEGKVDVEICFIMKYLVH